MTWILYLLVLNVWKKFYVCLCTILCTGVHVKLFFSSCFVWPGAQFIGGKKLSPWLFECYQIQKCSRAHKKWQHKIVYLTNTHCSSTHHRLTTKQIKIMRKKSIEQANTQKIIHETFASAKAHCKVSHFTTTKTLYLLFETKWTRARSHTIRKFINEKWQKTYCRFFLLLRFQTAFFPLISTFSFKELAGAWK